MPKSDPLSVLTQGVRRMSTLRLDDLARGFESFANPSAAGFLDSLGRTRPERVENMAAMLRRSSQADIEELGTIFGLAMARIAEEQATAGAHGSPKANRSRRAAEGGARRRTPSAAQRRRERRLAQD